MIAAHFLFLGESIGPATPPYRCRFTLRDKRPLVISPRPPRTPPSPSLRSRSELGSVPHTGAPGWEMTAGWVTALSNRAAITAKGGTHALLFRGAAAAGTSRMQRSDWVARTIAQHPQTAGGVEQNRSVRGTTPITTGGGRVKVLRSRDPDLQSFGAERVRGLQARSCMARGRAAGGGWTR